MDIDKLNKCQSNIDEYSRNKNLHEFQIKIIKNILCAFGQNKNIISVNLLPGNGKNIIISHFLDFLYRYNIVKKTLIISEDKNVSQQKCRILQGINPSIMMSCDVSEYQKDVLFLNNSVF